MENYHNKNSRVKVIREARNELLQAGMNLRSQNEKVAELRRSQDGHRKYISGNNPLYLIACFIVLFTKCYFNYAANCD